jgi:hypothetical protein
MMLFALSRPQQSNRRLSMTTPNVGDAERLSGLPVQEPGEPEELFNELNLMLWHEARVNKNRDGRIAASLIANRDESRRRLVALYRRGERGVGGPPLTESNFAVRLELVFTELMEGGPGGSCPYANVTHPTGFASVVARLLFSHWPALRGGVGGPAPREEPKK